MVATNHSTKCSLPMPVHVVSSPTFDRHNLLSLTNDVSDVAQENVRFVKPSMVHDDIVQLYESNCTFGRHFSDISDDGGRLSCSEELKYRYPDDDEYGKIWLQNRPDEEGFVSLSRTMPFTQSVFPRMHQA